MKIAVLLYGEVRTFETAVKTWNIKSLDNVDYFIHTQNESYDKYTNTIKKINESELKKILPNSKIILESLDNYKIFNEHSDIHYHHRSWRILNKHLTNEYDFVIIHRLDSILFIQNLEYLLNNFDKEILYLRSSINTEGELFVEDHFFMGSYKVIKYFLDNLPNGKDLIKSHTDTANYILSLPFTAQSYNYELYAFHLRENMVDFFQENYLNNEGNFLEYLKNFIKISHHTLENLYLQTAKK
jgi:hypothetical protein